MLFSENHFVGVHSVLSWVQLSTKFVWLSWTLKLLKRMLSGMTPLISGVPQ